MRTIGIELCDGGVLAAEMQEEEVKLLALEGSRHASPGFVYMHENGYSCGKEAEGYLRIDPRYVSDRFWDQLSLRASDLNISGTPPPYSELAFHHLQFVWEKICSDGPVDKTVLALPSEYLVGEDGDEEKIGLILGMVQHLQIPLAGLVDMATVTVAQYARRLNEDDDRILYIDIHQHATEISTLRRGQLIQRERLHRSRIGYNRVLGELLSKLANRFLSQTAFDIHHDAATEQAFYNQLSNLLETLTVDEEGAIELSRRTRSRKMLVPLEVVERHLEPINAKLRQFVQRTLQQIPANINRHALPIMVSSRVARLPGLMAQLRTLGGVRLYALPEGATAMAVARFGGGLDIIEDLEETPVTIDLPVAENGPLPTELKNRATIDDRATINDRATGDVDISRSAGNQDEGREPAPAGATTRPSHLVFRGVAHRIEPTGYTIGQSLKKTVDGLSLPSPLGFEAVEHGVLHVEDERLILEIRTPDGILLNGQPTAQREFLETGDVLTIELNGNAAELYLVCCAP